LQALRAACAFTAAFFAATTAQAGDWTPRAEFHDATGSSLARDTMIDWDYVNGKKPSYAEQRGLVGAPTVEVRRNYIYVEDTDGTLTIPSTDPRRIQEWFNFAVAEAYQVLPQEHVFVYVFTAFETNLGAFFYQPQYNDVTGIGQRIYDANGPRNPLEGFIFMNYWRFFEQSLGRFGQQVVRGFSRHTFNQETGHRWVVQWDSGPGLPDQSMSMMLGRDDTHWSYFMHSGGSPIEGNDWLDRGDGRFTTRTDFNNWRYSDLDLYLMGLKSQDQVQPWFVISNPDTMGFRDQQGQPLGRTSPPQILQTVTITGSRVNIDINHVVTRLGTRRPTAAQSPKQWKVLFVMLANRSSRLADSHKREFEGILDGYAAGFAEGVQNLGSLDYQLTAGPIPTLSPIGTACGQASDCDPAQSTMCTAPEGTTTNLCTRPCADASSCPGNWCCEANAPGSAFVCTPSQHCGQVTPPVDAGVSTADSGATMTMPPPDACTCDLTHACDDNCACDPECTRRDSCTCDLSFGCDPNCSCDPECLGVREPRGSSDCTCVVVPDQTPWSASLLALGLIGVIVARRRRRS